MRLMQFLGERNKNCLEILRRTDVNSMVTIERDDYYINFVYIFLWENVKQDFYNIKIRIIF